MGKEIEHRKGKDLERRTLQARMPFSYNPDFIFDIHFLLREQWPFYYGMSAKRI